MATLLAVGNPNAKAVLFEDIAPGQLVFKIANFDEGTLYDTQAVNGTVGVSNNPAAGAPLLDGATALQAANSHSIAAFGNNLEDSWGIAFVQQIFYANDLVNPIWTSVGDSQQLTVMFYGAQDFYLNQNAVGPGLQSSQTISSVGLRVDMYLQNTSDGSFTSFDQSLGPAARPLDVAGGTKANDASYPTVTDSNGTTFTLGVPVLTTVSTDGFLRGLGDHGGPATEFETTFNGDSLNGAGSGAAFVSVAPTLGGVGSLNAKYDTNSFLAPHVVGNTADFSIQFTSTTDGSGPWLVSSQDPIRTVLGSTSVPEPATGLAALGCILPAWFGRRRKASTHCK